MCLIAKLWNRDYKETMLFTCVTSYNGRAVIGPGFISAEHLLWKALLQIYHKTFVKFKIAHVVCV